ncbi:VOC family protein [Devosia sediminis]|uniref:VOC family protein n=1 Tax=Devosia sediminis TaxID=2798801 RepID=A0A934MKJ8_9HYPH|nr:VOC family protein [Devosia sediminis]MBJ3785223.1 VOC family protein [Devosia sediminis]
MLDHVSFSVADYDRSIAFYTATLAALGVMPMMSFDNDGGKITGFGANNNPFFWVGDGGALTGGRMHVAFAAKSRADVDAFYAAAMAHGGKDNGAPGLREHYHPTYYGAFVFDPDGHNIEAVCHAPG